MMSLHYSAIEKWYNGKSASKYKQSCLSKIEKKL